MARDQTYTLEIDGVQYEFNNDADITLSALRQIKAWFPNLGTYSAFRNGYLLGDPDALACIRWIIRRRENVKPNPEPTNPEDFSLGDFMNTFIYDINIPCEACGGSVKDRRIGRGWNFREEEAEEVPLDLPPATSPTPTPADTKPATPMPFVRSISASSPPSATLDPSTSTDETSTG